MTANIKPNNRERKYYSICHSRKSTSLPHDEWTVSSVCTTQTEETASFLSASTLAATGSYHNSGADSLRLLVPGHPLTPISPANLVPKQSEMNFLDPRISAFSVIAESSLLRSQTIPSIDYRSIFYFFCVWTRRSLTNLLN